MKRTSAQRQLRIAARAAVELTIHPMKGERNMNRAANRTLAALAATAGLILLAPAAGRAQTGETAAEHAAHAGKPEAAHEGESLKADLGTTEIAGLKLRVTQGMLVAAGGEGAFDLTVEGAKPPKAIRGWVGTADAKGSLKAKAEKGEAGWHLHLEVPKTLGADAMLWIDVEPAAGPKGRASFAVKRK
jgi:hypothetical protein